MRLYICEKLQSKKTDKFNRNRIFFKKDTKWGFTIRYSYNKKAHYHLEYLTPMEEIIEPASRPIIT